MDVNFVVFAGKIKSGEKRQTIRSASDKWANVKAGDRLTLYTGLRTKECRKLGEAVVESITPITLQSAAGWVEANTQLGVFRLSSIDLQNLARRDGFENTRDFFAFFNRKYDGDAFEFYVIRWKDFWEAKNESNW